MSSGFTNCRDKLIFPTLSFRLHTFSVHSFFMYSPSISQKIGPILYQKAKNAAVSAQPKQKSRSNFTWFWDTAPILLQCLI